MCVSNTIPVNNFSSSIQDPLYKVMKQNLKLKIPRDLFVEIFKFNGCIDIASVSLVSKKFNSLSLKSRWLVICDLFKESTYKYLFDLLIPYDLQGEFKKFLIGKSKGELLDELYLKNNKLTTLSEKLKNLKNLRRLILSENNFTTLPQILVDLTSLIELDLEHNKITELPKNIFNLKNLKILNLSSNQFSKFPKEILKFTEIAKVCLRHNKFTDLPKHLENLGNPQTVTIQLWYS